MATSVSSLEDVVSGTSEAMMTNNQQPLANPTMDHRLMKAIVEGNKDLIERLLNEEEAVAPPTGVETTRSTASNHVSVSINADETTSSCVVACVPQRSKLLQGVTYEGDGVLHVAARFGHVELVRFIFQREGALVAALVLAKNNRGETPLHCAAVSSGLMVSLLLSIAAKDTTERFAKFLRARNQSGETCLHEAVRCRPIETVRLVITVDASLEEDEGNPALVKIVDNEGVSPLYLATTLCRIEVVQILTERSSKHSASFAGPAGKTALHAAVCWSKEISDLLVKWNKGLINEKDEFGSTPLHLLASRGRSDIAKLLLVEDDEHSSAYCPDSMGSLPIHVAAANGTLEVIKVLLEECPDCMWSRDASGRSFLHVAVQERSYSVVEYACRCREPIFAGILNMRDEGGNTALHLAVQKGNQPIFCSLMRRREVCLNFTNKEGRTPLDLAFLSITETFAGLTSFLDPREWIFDDLVLGGAKLGIVRSDDRTRNVAALDKEAKSKTVSKFAGLMAICAGLILNVAFAGPWNVARYYHKDADAPSSETMGKSVKIWAHALKAFIISDAIACVSSAVAMFCCTFAGFSIVDYGTRLRHLIVGYWWLHVASIAIVAVFTLGVYLVFAPIDFIIAVFICVFALAALILSSFTPVGMMFLHTRTLSSRFGLSALKRILLFPGKNHRQLMLATALLVAIPLPVFCSIVLLSFI